MGNRATNFIFHLKKMPKPLSIFLPNLFQKHSPIKPVIAILVVTYTLHQVIWMIQQQSLDAEVNLLLDKLMNPCWGNHVDHTNCWPIVQFMEAQDAPLLSISTASYHKPSFKIYDLEGIPCGKWKLNEKQVQRP